MIRGSYSLDERVSIRSNLPCLATFLSFLSPTLTILSCSITSHSSLCLYRVQRFQQGSLATSTTQVRAMFGACSPVSLFVLSNIFVFHSPCSLLESVLVHNAIGLSVLFLKLYYFLSFRIEFLRHLRSFFQIMFKIETKTAEEEHMGGEKVLMTCVGIGFSNLSKTIR